MTNPIIGYQNIGRTANSWSTEQARLAFNGLTYDGWTASSIGQQSFSFFGPLSSANYIGIAEHNLGGGQVQLFADGNLVTSTIVASDSPFLLTFNTTSASNWQIVTTLGSDLARVNVCNVGLRMELERGIWVGHSPMKHNRANRYINNLSDSGQLLGRKLISEGAVGSIEVDNITSDWVRNEWEPFSIAAEKYGFFFQHNPDQYPDEVAYCWSTGDAGVSQSRVGGLNNKGLNTLSINVRGIV